MKDKCYYCENEGHKQKKCPFRSDYQNAQPQMQPWEIQQPPILGPGPPNYIPAIPTLIMVPYAVAYQPFDFNSFKGPVGPVQNNEFGNFSGHLPAIKGPSMNSKRIKEKLKSRKRDKRFGGKRDKSVKFEPKKTKSKKEELKKPVKPKECSKENSLDLNQLTRTIKRKDRSSSLDPPSLDSPCSDLIQWDIQPSSTFIPSSPVQSSLSAVKEEKDATEFSLISLDKIKRERDLSPMSISPSDDCFTSNVLKKENQIEKSVDYHSSNNFIRKELEVSKNDKAFRAVGGDVDLRNPDEKATCEWCVNEQSKYTLVYKDVYFFIFIRPFKPVVNNTFVVRSMNHSMSFFLATPKTKKRFEDLKFKLNVDFYQSGKEIVYINYFYKHLDGELNHWEFTGIPLDVGRGKDFVRFLQWFMKRFKSEQAVEKNMFILNEDEFSYEKVGERVRQSSYFLVECNKVNVCYQMRSEDSERRFKKTTIDDALCKFLQVNIDIYKFPIVETNDILEDRCKNLKRKLGFK